MSYYQPEGSEFIVNSVTDGFQNSPQLTGLAGGGFIALWHSETNNVRTDHFQLFDANGARVGGQRQVNGTDAVEALPNGGFLLLSESSDSLSVKSYSARGVAVGGSILVNDGAAASYGEAEIAALPSGGFVVTWTERLILGGYYPHVVARAQIFDAAGQAVAAPFTTSALSQSSGKEAQVAVLDNGNIVTFVNSSEAGLVAQVRDATGAAIGSSFVIQDDADNGHGEFDVTALAGGGFVLTWAHTFSTGWFVGINDLRAQIFDDAGNKVGGEISVDPGGPDQYGSTDTIALSTGGFLIAWAAEGHETGTEPLRTGVVAQAFSAAGERVGDMFLVNTQTTGYQAGTSVAALSNGAFVVGWADYDVGTMGGFIDREIKAQRFTAPITGTDANDSLAGTTGADLILARAGDDVISGLAGDDRIDGGAGDDRIDGGAGNDTIDGGAGQDTASYASATAGVTVSLAVAGAQATGGAGNDTLGGIENLTGSAFDDVLTGDAQANVIEGGAGNDMLSGGGGTDTLSYAGATAGVIISLAITAGQATGGAGTDTVSGFENLTGSAFNDVLTGAAGNGRNIIDGGAGDDIVDGGPGTGPDTLIGGAGADTVSYAGAAARVNVNLALTTGQNTIGGGVDILSGFENATGSAFNDLLAGTAGNNVLAGGAGADLLDGLAGNDMLLGGVGDDTLAGGDGDDGLDGGVGADVASYAMATAGVSVSLLISGAQATGGGGTDTLTGIEGLIGSNFDDVLIGDAGSNSLVGGLGNDLIRGDLGNDVIDGGSGNDTLDYALVGAGVTVNLISQSAQNTGGAGIDTIRGIENVIGTAFNDVLTGNEYGNILTGGDGNDMLVGNLGNDTLAGGAGIDTASYASAAAGVKVNLTLTGSQTTVGAGGDTLSGIENLNGSAYDDQFTGDGGDNVLTGNAGNDLLIGGLGNDTLSGGAGLDTASYAGATTGVSVSLLLATAQDTLGAGTDTLASIENLIGSAQADTLIGNAQNNIITGGLGDDVIDGGSGADTLDGGNGNDVLKGGGGNDILIGGAGRDTLTGGAGNDSFVYQTIVQSPANLNADRITDFAAGDILDLSAIDANSAAAGDQAFARVANFTSVAGQLVLAFDAGANTTTLRGDTDGNGVADFSILFTGDVTALTGTWVL